MIAIRSEREIGLLREANAIVAEVHDLLSEMVVPGVTTGELDRAAEALILARGAKPAFKGYRGYPATLCVSVESEVVHGIPGRRALRAGEIVSIDVGTLFRGYYGDAAVTHACGRVDGQRLRLMEATDLSLARAVAAARAGNNLREIGRAVQRTCKAAGFGVVRDFVGHGIGTALHEEPQVLNFDSGEPGPVLRPGMVLAIEPMVNMGTHRVRVLKDGWTAVTADGKPSAHFEHSVVVREHGGEILSQGTRIRWGCPDGNVLRAGSPAVETER
ncbi:MAG: type I methionyl aminopeptidase [Candidatus Hydrogenedentes bacterium]|nr:type I methionyl aminopeptidase [Candidatus Hydrogenedentota bacterium]